MTKLMQFFLLWGWILAFPAMAQSAGGSDAVVHVSVEAIDPVTQERKVLASGSGFLVDKGGHLITSRTIVMNDESVGPERRRVWIRLRNRTAPAVQAMIVACDAPQTNLCVLTIPSSAIVAANIEKVFSLSCRTLNQGEAISALGFSSDSPFELTAVQFRGQVASPAMDFQKMIDWSPSGDGVATFAKIRNMLASNIALARGMSGGPVLDAAGRVVAIADSDTILGKFNIEGLSTGNTLLRTAGLECPGTEAISKDDAQVFGVNVDTVAPKFNPTGVGRPIEWLGGSKAQFDPDMFDVIVRSKNEALGNVSTVWKKLDKLNPERTVEFLFATSRGRADLLNRPGFSFERADALTLGAARVRIPEDHKFGHIELPGSRSLLGLTLGRESEDPRKHFILQNVTVVDRETWLASARQRDEALVFVHGYNTSFDDALLQTAQIVFDLQYDGLPILFSWPSYGGTLAYSYDQNSALGARQDFIDLIRLLEANAGIKKVNVLAHSMGNLVVLDALANEARTANPVRVGELIMAAPDIDQRHYRQAMKEIKNVAKGLTLYASSADKAMVASRQLAMAPRAGDVGGDRPLLVDGIDTIDVTAIGNEMFEIDHFHPSRRSVLNDIKLILKPGIRPPNDRLSEIRIMPEGSKPPLYWRFVP